MSRKIDKETFDVLKYYFGYFKKYKFWFLTILFLNILINIISIILPYFLKEFIDLISSAGVSKSLFISNIFDIFIWIILLEIIYLILKTVSNFYLPDKWLTIRTNVYRECFNYIHRHSYRFFSNNFSGSLVKKIVKFVSGFESFIELFLFFFLPFVVELIGIFVVIFLQNKKFGIIFLVWILIYSILQYVFYKWNLKYNKKVQEQESKIVGHLSDTITNNFTIATFASYDRELDFFDEYLKTYKKFGLKSWNIGNIIKLINDLLKFAFLAGVLLFVILYWMRGYISIGIVTLLWIYIFKIFSKMDGLRYFFRNLNSIISQSFEMVDILNQKWEIQDDPDAKDLEVKEGKIDFRNVTFYYNSGQYVFENFNLSINPGEKIALVGHSGSGKTTLIRLLFRFFDIQGGKILIDGQDISKVTQESLRKNISMVPQEPLLFHRTLKENIAYGKPDASMEEIIEASKKAYCHDFIMKFENGYDTLVGERGIKLSGGQRQRIAIARAILENKKIFVMDEATSSLDSESEKYIQKALKNVFENKTVIVVAHRLSTIIEMDRIIVLEDGKIVEEGNHYSLLQKGGVYKKLWTIQTGKYLI